MNIEINKDFLTEYKDEFWKGFSAKEVATIVAAGGVAVGVVLFLNLKFGMRPSEAVYAAIPFTLPILIGGFYKYQGYMSFRKLIEEIRYSKKCRELNFNSRDNEIIANPRYRIGHYMSGKNKRKGGKRNVSHNKPK